MAFSVRVAGAAMLICLSATSAEAGYVVTLKQVGPDVVAHGSGPIDLTGLSFDLSSASGASLFAAESSILTGPTQSTEYDAYVGVSGPMSFGPGTDEVIFADSGSGDIVGISVDPSAGDVFVPFGYVSNSPLSDSSTYLNQTFADLGLTPGAYEWTWGTGEDQNFTLIIGASAGPGPTPVPERSTLALLGVGVAGLLLAGARRHGCQPVYL